MRIASWRGIWLSFSDMVAFDRLIPSSFLTWKTRPCIFWICMTCFTLRFVSGLKHHMALLTSKDVLLFCTLSTVWSLFSITLEVLGQGSTEHQLTKLFILFSIFLFCFFCCVVKWTFSLFLFWCFSWLIHSS